MSDLTLVGILCVGMAVGLVAMSPYRHWLRYMAAGMGVWCGVELLRWGIQNLTGWTASQSYVAVMGLVLSTVATLVIRREMCRKPVAPRCIEHTPVYDN